MTWDRDTVDRHEPLAGRILFHGNRILFVIPPGGRADRLPVDSYTVRVTTNPGTDHAETVVGGKYTVR